MKSTISIAIVIVALSLGSSGTSSESQQHHHHADAHQRHKHSHKHAAHVRRHHGHKHTHETTAALVGKKTHKESANHSVHVNASLVPSSAAQTSHSKKVTTEGKTMASKKGVLFVNGPLPKDFTDRFTQAASKATGVKAADVKVLGSKPVDSSGLVELDFEAPTSFLAAIEDQAADPDSKLAGGALHSFLVEKGSDVEGPAPAPPCDTTPFPETPVTEKGIDIDTAMPYGDLEPFGREDTAQELTEASIKASDDMVDQIERAEVAEEKRAVFRSETRLRGAAITSFDGVARSQTGNIDEYNTVHKWRSVHPLHHLADEESDITKWAFPDNADF